MKKLLTSVALAGCVIASGSVVANGMGEDGSWQFKTPNEKFYLLEVERQRQLLDDGGYNMHTTVNDYGDKHYDIVNNIETQIEQYIIGNQTVIEIVGDDNDVKVGQLIGDNDQSNGYADVDVDDDLNVHHGGKKGGHKPPMHPDQGKE